MEMTEEDQQPVDADHSKICKFSMREDPTYQKLVKMLSRMLKARGTSLFSLGSM